jgi:hypothetical protein
MKIRMNKAGETKAKHHKLDLDAGLQKAKDACLAKVAEVSKLEDALNAHLQEAQRFTLWCRLRSRRP